MSDDAKNKYLEFAQSAIGRMAQSSFLLKGWAATLVVGAMTLSRTPGGNVIAAGFFLTVCFWILDAFYLARERQFVRIYEAARREDTPSFDMSPSRHAQRWDWVGAAFSVTMLLFYAGLALSVCIIGSKY